MTNRLKKTLLSICLMGVGLGVNAQVVVDSSLGSGGALNGPNFQIPDNLGKTVGENLFHSFAEFSLQTGQSATFTGPEAIQNILGRVTGSKVSEIDGLIKSEITGANLYLLNPKGFLFGENAKVDVDGAFTVSARESIKLGEEGSFNAVNPDQSVFVSAAPEAFGFLGENPGGGITFQGSRIVTSGGIGLVAGDITLDNKTKLTGQDGATIRLAGQAILLDNESKLDVSAESELKGGSIFIESEEFNLKGKSIVRADGLSEQPSGLVSIVTTDMEMEKGTEIRVVAEDGEGGGITIESGGVGGLYTIDGSLVTDANAGGAGGDLHIEGGGIVVGEKGKISANGAEGAGGSIRLETAGDVEILGRVSSDAKKSGDGGGVSMKVGGELKIKGGLEPSFASASTLTRSAEVSSKAIGTGNAGTIEIEAGSVLMEDFGLISGESTSINSGKGGEIKITADSLEMKDMTEISVATRGLSDGGNIVLDIDDIFLNGKNVWHMIQWKQTINYPRIAASTFYRSVDESDSAKGGNGGDIVINGSNVKLAAGGSIAVDTWGSGDSGDLVLNTGALDISANGGAQSGIWGALQGSTQLSSWVYYTGNGGDVSIVADSINMNGGGIYMHAVGVGDSGNLDIKAKTMTLGKRLAFARVNKAPPAPGTYGLNGGVWHPPWSIPSDYNSTIFGITVLKSKGADLNIQVDRLSMSGGAIINVSAETQGKPGNIQIVPLTGMEESEMIIDSGTIITEVVSGEEKGGNLQLKSGKITLEKGEINSNAGLNNSGGAGDVRIEAREFAIKGTRTKIVSTTKGRGDGGQVFISADQIRVEEASILSESISKNKTNPGGNAGEIRFEGKMVSFVDGAKVSSSTVGLGDSGQVLVKADELSIEGLGEGRKRTSITSNTGFGEKKGQEGKGGKAGSVVIEAGEVSVGPFATVASSTVGSGDAGGVEIKAGRLEVKGEGTLVSGQSGYEYGGRDWERSQPATGKGGNIEIEAETVEIGEGGSLSVASTGSGEGGSMLVKSQVIELNGNAAMNASTNDGEGGGVHLEVNEFKLSKGTSINSISKGHGRGGAVTIESGGVGGVYTIDGSLVTDAKGAGAGGDLHIEGGGIVVGEKGNISANGAEGAGGSIRLETAGDVEILGRVSSDAKKSGDGGGVSMKVGGELKIKGGLEPSFASASTLTRSAEVSSKAIGTGNAGTIEIEAGSVLMEDFGLISGESTSINSGKGGEIKITADSLEMKDMTEISVATRGLSDGGNIVLDIDDIFLNGKNVWHMIQWKQTINYPRIAASTFYRSVDESDSAKGGNGGDIVINGSNVKLAAGGSIAVDTWGSGDSGDLVLNTGALDISANGGAQSGIWGALQGSTQLSSWVYYTGNGGDVSIVADSINMNGGGIYMHAVGVGDSGNLDIKAKTMTLGKRLAFARVNKAPPAPGTYGLNGGVWHPPWSIPSDYNSTIFGITVLKSKGADLNIQVDRLSMSGGAIINVSAETQGKPGNIQIVPLTGMEESEMIIDSGTIITEVVSGEEKGGNLQLKSGKITLEKGEINSNAGLNNSGGAGDVRIEAREFAIKGTRTKIVSTTKGRGDGGQVFISADQIRVEEASILSESISKNKTNPGGNAGEIRFEGKMVSFVDGAKVSSSTVGLGDSGQVLVKADELSIEGLGEGRKRTSITSNTGFGEKKGQEGKGGKAGSVVIEAGEVSVGPFATVASSTVGSGDAGGVEIKAGRLEVKGEGTLVSGQSGYEYGGRDWERSQPATGKGGNIEIEAETVEIGEGGMLTVASTGNGVGGSMNIIAGAMTVADGGKVESSSFAEGDAGTIRVSGATLELSEGLVSSSSVGEGAAGSIELDLAERLKLVEGSSVSVSSSQADGGDIWVRTDGEVYLSGSELTASAAGDGGSVRLLGSGNVFMSEGTVSAEAGQDGGNIEVSSPQTLVLQRSGLVANAIEGDGGNISIVAEGFLPSRESVISASSEFGLEGSIEIETPETDVGSGLVVLPESLVEAEVNLSDRCALMLSGDVSSFFLNGDGGVPVWSRVNYVPSVFLGDEDGEE